MEIASDVVIVGAGPAGSSTAKIIAEKGYDVILAEKDEFPGKTNICAGGMPAYLIKELGLSAQIIEKNIKREKHYFPWGVRTGDLDQVTVMRSVFDNSLAQRAVEEGARLITDTLIKDVVVKKDGIIASSSNSTIKSKLLVFADGPNTLAYRKFGIGFKPDPDNTSVSVACEVQWEDNPFDQYEYYYGEDIMPWGFAWIFPKKNSLNVGVGGLKSKLDTNIINSLNYLFDGNPLTSEKLKGRKILSMGSALIPAAPAKTIFSERILVAGDAAGMVDPITGGGIPFAIDGGRLAGEVCVKALEAGDCSSRFLSQYQTLWQKTNNYYAIYRNYLLSDIFLYLTKFKKNIFFKIR